jgi:SAM-dependent methyltransferase
MGTVKDAVQLCRRAVKRICKVPILALMRHSLPLAARMQMARWAWQRSSLSRLFPPLGLLRDLADHDPNRFHRFLWSHHLAYAETYEVSRFGQEKLEISRRMLFADIQQHLRARAIAPERDVRSVFEAGCSLGYLLRYAETIVFPGATRFFGVDVDRYAIEKGRAHLRDMQSKVQIAAGEASDLESVIADQQYDVVLCCGVLLYFDEPTAARIVKTLLRHTRMVLGLISLAHSGTHNCRLKHSETRPSDQGFVHNLDAMIRAADGKLVAHRWMPLPPSEGTSPPYFVLAEPRSV